jgi:perosamine synthetase
VTPTATDSPALVAAASDRPPVRLRHVAPAGSPIHAGDLLRWTGRMLSGRGHVDALRATVCETFGVAHCFPVSTGRAALTVLLQALARLAPDRREVVVPAYTCFSVPASIVKAGLTPRIVDIDPATLDFSAEALAAVDGGPVLAIIATNLFGMPNDLPALSQAARRLGAFLIDDAAQAMGASVGGRASGTWGDAGLYSLDKGKNISAIDGGLLVTGSADVAREIERGWRALGRPGAVTVTKDAAKVFAYAAMLPPAIYWIPRSIPQLGLGLTAFTMDFPLDEMPPLLASLALTMLPRLGDYNAQRVARAGRLIDQFAHVDGVRVPAPVAGASPVYLRLPLLVDDPARQAPLIEALNQQGIGATGSYPTSLADVEALGPHLTNPGEDVPGARYVAARIVTLPTHPYVDTRDLDRTVAVVRREAAR